MLCSANEQDNSRPPKQVTSATMRAMTETVAEASTPQVRTHETNAILDGMDIDYRVADRDNEFGGMRIEG